MANFDNIISYVQKHNLFHNSNISINNGSLKIKPCSNNFTHKDLLSLYLIISVYPFLKSSIYMDKGEIVISLSF